MARRATKIAEERAKSEFVLVLDAGDSLVGDRDPARKTQGQTSVEIMNRLGYDAMALGPQDLALGLPVLQKRIAEAQFTLLSANAVVSATGKLVAVPYLLREFAGHHIAIVGLSGGSGTSEITVRDPLATAKATVANLKDQADVIILLSHAGPSVDQQIADSVPGITAIVGGGPGGRPAPIVSKLTGTPILHADTPSPGHAGRLLGIGQFTFDAEGRITAQSWRRVALDPTIADDPATAAWVKEQLAP